MRNPIHTQATLRKAFSLVELIIAIGVISGGLLIFFGFFAPSLSSARDTRVQTEITGWLDRIEDFVDSDAIYDAIPSTITTGATDPKYDQLATWVNMGAPPDSAQPLFLAWAEVDSDGNHTYEIGAAAPASIDSEDLSGEFWAVVLKKGMQLGAQEGNNTYDFNNVGTRAFFPILVELYKIDYNTFKKSNLTAAAFADRDPDFAYTIGKLR